MSEEQTETIEAEPVSIEKYGEGVIIRGANGKFLKGSTPPKPITVANAREFQSRLRTNSLRGQLKGLLRGAGIDPADTDEELIAQAESAADAFAAHLAKTFIASKNLRGMGEVYNKIMGPLAGDQAKEGAEGQAVPAIILAIQQVFKGK